MSFSSEVKEELEKHMNSARHCQIAEMAAFVINLSNVYDRDENEPLVFKAENRGAINKVQALLKKTYGINTEINVKKGRTEQYEIVLSNFTEVLESIKIQAKDIYRVNETIVKMSCCKRAFLQGTFASIGSMTSPEKGYHLEFVSGSEEQMKQLKELIADFNVDGRITTRKKNFVLYIKEGAAIVDLLNVMNAHVSLMKMENEIILKDMRNDVNRKVNCETANLIKSINAASKQVEDIEYIKSKGEYNRLPEALKQMADIRIQYPDAPLKDLGALLDPPVGKSGVNHRLRRLSEIAADLRGEN